MLTDFGFPSGQTINVNNQLKELVLTQQQVLAILSSTKDESQERDPSGLKIRWNQQSAIEVTEDPTQTRYAPAASHPASHNRSRSSSCPKSCQCVCHYRRNISLFQITQRWTGAFFISHTGRLWLRPVCTIRGCRGLSTTAINIRYTCPAWLASRIVSAWLKSTPLTGPELLLRTVRLIRTDAYAFAESGRLHDLRAIYATGKACIHDANPGNGESALIV